MANWGDISIHLYLFIHINIFIYLFIYIHGMDILTKVSSKLTRFKIMFEKKKQTSTKPNWVELDMARKKSIEGIEYGERAREVGWGTLSRTG